MNPVIFKKATMGSNTTREESLRVSSHRIHSASVLSLPPSPYASKPRTPKPTHNARDSFEKPKRSRTAYNIFFKMQQEKLNAARRNGAKVLTTAAAISVHWKNLSPHERSVYFQLAAEDKFRYYQEKREYENNLLRQKKELQQVQPAGGRASTASAPHPSDAVNSLVPEDWRVPEPIYVPGTPHQDGGPRYSQPAIALLASKLDQSSIDFIIKVLK